MVWLPTLSAEVLRLALPPLRVTVHRMVLPSWKVTLPVGVPEPGELAVTVAVKVTDWPNTEVAGDALTAVAVPSLLTVSLAVPELVVKLPSPLYEAEIVWLPTLSAEVLRLAVPPLRLT